MSFALAKVPAGPPSAVKCGHQTDGAGDLYLAVANTQYGTIPGKAKDDTCWYPYGGEEVYTSDFKWVVASSYQLVASSGNGPAPGAQVLATQNDGAGDLFGAVANTEWGKIPGKAQGNTCWFPYGGEERKTNDFEWVVFAPDEYSLVSMPSGPANSVQCGHQTDGAGDLWLAVANTDNGTIPGKAKDSTCWYPYGGEEVYTSDFQWVMAAGFSLVSSSPGQPIANQTDGAGDLEGAVANTPEGKIPGKAKGSECWYPYGGREERTTDFQFVAFK